MKGTLLVTGASGRMGRILLQHWQNRDVIGLDRVGADRNVDLGQGPEACASAFVGVETVVHLAADPDPGSLFERGGYGNTLATLTVVGTCLRAGVRRLIYASSVWADHPAWGLSYRMTWYAAEPLRVFRRPFGLGQAAKAWTSAWA
jgi:nucleoside-diphosphate-sugar epimerase